MNEELSQRLARGDYTVDCEAVAEAVLRQWVTPTGGAIATAGRAEAKASVLPGDLLGVAVTLHRPDQSGA
jgi:hypothetical protein